jgi:uncharacterized protein
MRRVAEAGILPMRSGIISGIPGLLLNEGMWMNIDVIVLLVNVLSDVPDFRAAAMVSEAVSKIVPGAYCNINALIKEAETAEKNLKMIRNSQVSTELGEGMYR